jgi:predicted O-linked N-acetylglucosamine transferase (SPINDLY family)
MTAELLAAGWRFHQAGDLPRAEQTYRQVVQQEPGNAQGWFLLGALYQERGDLATASASLEQALRLRPTFAEALHHQSVVFLKQGRVAEAAANLRQALHLKPNDAGMQTHLAVVLIQLGQYAEAVTLLQTVLRSGRDQIRTQTLLREALVRQASAQGLTCLEQGKLEDAVAHFRQALEVRPDFLDAYNNLGNALFRQGKLDEAIACYQQALRLRPDLVQAHVNLGIAWRERQRPREAEASFREALGLRPDMAEAHNGLGTLLLDENRLTEAINSLQRAVQLEPNSAPAHNNLGLAWWGLRRFDEALASFAHALRLQPGHAEAHLNFGGVLKDLGRHEEALAAYRTALRLKPDAAPIHSNLLLLLQYHPGYDAPAIWEEIQRWNRQHALPLQPLIRPHRNHPDPERRLRIGYVSPDFCGHAVTFFTTSLLAHHDHRQFEIFCYANVAHPDALTERLRGYADAWHDTRGLSDEQVAELIRSDQIDILVDLAMHTAGNRLLIFARKPAPVQVSWVAYPGTTGLSAIDYRLTDPYLDPSGLFDACYAEESVRLADTFWCYNPLTEPVPINPLPALQNGYVTLGCLNNFCKINDGVLTLWAQVLHAVPQARLLLMAPRGQARDRVLATLQLAGVAAERVEFVDKQSRQEYLRLHHRIDVGLDPFPYNGHTTSLDGFWMGVPLVTLVGRTVVGRAGWSQLCNLGLQELAAQTPEQYVALVEELAGDLPRLQELRSTLRQRMERSPLMDAPRFAHQVELAYRQMWWRWCSGLSKPEA